jgi:corrinoid protein of di/trimethylamine methyltransferase
MGGTALNNSALLEELARAVVQMDEAGAAAAARKALASGLDPFVAINDGLSVGMREVGRLYDTGEYFVPEILICSDAMNAAVEILKPHIRRAPGREPVTIILGVIEGDIHDIGKNIVKIMLDASGYHVVDLGRDVSAERFVQAAREAERGLVGLSTLMSTTMENMGKVVSGLSEAGLRKDFRVMLGGAPCSEAFAREIGADGFGRNAKEAVELAERLSASLAVKSV